MPSMISHSVRPPITSHRRAACPHGFTIVELLIVLASLGIMIGLLASAVFSAGERARSAECQSQLRQLGMAYDSAVSSRRRVVSASWNEVLMNYVDDVTELFQCPVDVDIDVESDASQTSYGMNRRASRLGTDDAQKILLLDYGTKEVDFLADDPSEAWEGDVRPRHLGEVNVLYHDGSAHPKYPADIDPSDCAILERHWLPMRDFALLPSHCRNNDEESSDTSAEDESSSGSSGVVGSGDSGTVPPEVLCHLDSELGLSRPVDDYYLSHRGRDEKYLSADFSAFGHDAPDHWYYVTPDGDLFELTPPSDRPSLEGEFVEHVGLEVYQDPSLLHESSEGEESACP